MSWSLTEPEKKFRLNNNHTQTAYYDLDFDQMMLVGMRESKAVRRSVLAKLKVMHGPQIPQTLPEALRLAADLAEQNAQLESKLAIAAPKVEFVDHYVEATGAMGFREAAKLLKVKETDFRLFLIEQGIMYRLAGKLTPYAQHLDAGRFTMKTGENQNNGMPSLRPSSLREVSSGSPHYWQVTTSMTRRPNKR